MTFMLFEELFAVDLFGEFINVVINTSFLLHNNAENERVSTSFLAPAEGVEPVRV